MRRNYFYLTAITVLLLIVPVLSSALEEKPAFIIRSKYFSILGPENLNIVNVLTKLNYDYFLQVDSLLDRKGDSPKFILAKTLDAIFLESCRILGINVYSFESTLEFLVNQNMVKIVIKDIAGVDIEERAFYLHDLKTIYISVEDLSVGVLGHEMAHAIISNYFGAPPSGNIQEILAGYVDYSLSKSANKP